MGRGRAGPRGSLRASPARCLSSEATSARSLGVPFPPVSSEAPPAAARESLEASHCHPTLAELWRKGQKIHINSNLVPSRSHSLCRLFTCILSYSGPERGFISVGRLGGPLGSSRLEPGGMQAQDGAQGRGRASRGVTGDNGHGREMKSPTGDPSLRRWHLRDETDGRWEVRTRDGSALKEQPPVPPPAPSPVPATLSHLSLTIIFSCFLISCRP